MKTVLDIRIIMEAFKQVIILLVLTIALSEAKHRQKKCRDVCPPCNMELDKTMYEFAERILNAKGPQDGLCGSTEVPYVMKGKVYGYPYDACCCLPLPQSPTPLKCKPRDPKVPECANNFGIGFNETITEYFIRVGKELSNAPTDGCCRDGTYKYICPADLTNTDEDKCVCLLNSNAQTPTPPRP